MKTRNARQLTTALCGGLMLTAAMAAGAAAEEASLGKDLYAEACAVCHGMDGKGTGEFAEHLKVRPSDLTVLAKGNHGEFPFLKVYQIVDGRPGVRGHSGGDMPIWGNVFSRDIADGGKPYAAELYVRARIVSLVDYVSTLQQ